MMSALIIYNSVIDHNALGSYPDNSCSGLILSPSPKKGIAEGKSFGLVAAQPGLRCRVDVCGGPEDVRLRRDGLV